MLFIQTIDCPLCDAHFSRRGYGRHRGSRVCRSRQLAMHPERFVQGGVPPDIQAQSPSPVYATIRGDYGLPEGDYEFPEEDYDEVYSVMSDFEIGRYSVPDSLLDFDEDDIPREDGRHQKLVDFVNGIMKERQPSRYRQWITSFFFYFSHVLDTGARLVILYLFITAMMYCQSDLCHTHLFLFWASSKK